MAKSVQAELIPCIDTHISPKKIDEIQFRIEKLVDKFEPTGEELAIACARVIGSRMYVTGFHEGVNRQRKIPA